MNPKNKPLRAACVVLTSALAMCVSDQSARAGILSTTGAAHAVSSSPFDVRQDEWESNTRARVFQESFGVSFKQDIEVDFVDPGHYRNRPQLGQGVIEGGVVMNSYLLHQDNKSAAQRRLAGSILFDEEIIGVIVKKTRLQNSDGLLGDGKTTYEPTLDLGRGLEMSRGHDSIRISNSRRRLTFNLVTTDAMDEIRIITRAVAVPAPGALALLGLAGLTAIGRRRRA